MRADLLGKCITRMKLGHTNQSVPNNVLSKGGGGCSLRGTTAYDMDGEAFATCLPLACNPCRRETEVHLEAVLSFWTWHEKRSVLFCIPRTLQKWIFSIQMPVSVLLWIKSCRILTAGGREACVWSRELEARFGNP